jgi:hypothetical protein
MYGRKYQFLELADMYTLPIYAYQIKFKNLWKN